MFSTAEPCDETNFVPSSSPRPNAFPKVIGRVLNDTSLECISPSVPLERNVSVTVALRYTNTKRKSDFVVKSGSSTEKEGSGEDAGLLFQFYRVESVSGIRPYEGPVRGGTAITVTGANFRNTRRLVVRFAYSGTFGSNSSAVTEMTTFDTTTATIPARYISSQELKVKAPRCPLGLGVGGYFFVGVSSNGRDFTPSSDSPLFFYDATEPFLQSVSPGILREGGGVVVTVRGSGFPETFPSTLTCVFGGGDDAVPATRHSMELLTCVSPARRRGPAVLTVTSYGQSFLSDGDLSVEYIGDLRLLSSWPVLGPAIGGTAVTVLGEGFHPEEKYACAFGSPLQVSPVEAVLVNDSAISCQTPMIFGSDKVTLQVMTTQDDVFTPSGSYVYTDIALTTEIAGGTDGNYSPTSLHFEYHEEITISRVSPSNGPSSGGTIVRVSGSGFLDLPQAACQFGAGEPTAATVINSGTLVCTTPSLNAAGGPTRQGIYNAFLNTSRAEKGVELRVTMNSADFSSRNTSVAFLYDDELAVLALIPDRGPATGGVRVLVRGSGFRPDERLACRFGLQVAAAQYVREDTIACWAPPQVRVAMVVVSVTLNGQDFSSGRQASAGVKDDALGAAAVFTYTDRAAVTGLEPDSGPTRGGTAVTVSGVNFANSSVLLCRFGNLVTSTAVFVSTETVTCVSPAVPVGAAGRVYLEVSDSGSSATVDESSSSSSSEDGINSLPDLRDPGDDPALWTNNRMEFMFTEDPVALAAFPASGPSEGGTRVSLTGSGFQDLPELGCRFGGAPTLARQRGDKNDDGPDNGLAVVDVAATFISPTEVACVAPKQALEWTNSYGSSGSASSNSISAGATVRVAVTLNGQDYGLRMAQFIYYPTPKIHSISPDRGPTLGGTMVIVSGESLTNAGAYQGFTDRSLLCRFGGPEGTTVQATPVIGGSDDALQCRSPPDPRQEDGGNEVSLATLRRC